MGAVLLVAAPLITPPLQRALDLAAEYQFDEAVAIAETELDRNPGSQAAHWVLPFLYFVDPDRTTAEAQREYLPLALAHADPAKLDFFTLRYEQTQFSEHLLVSQPDLLEANWGRRIVDDTRAYTRDHPDDPFGWMSLSIALGGAVHRPDSEGSRAAALNAVLLAPNEPIFCSRYIRQTIVRATSWSDFCREQLASTGYDGRYAMLSVITKTYSLADLDNLSVAPELRDDVNVMRGLLLTRQSSAADKRRGEQILRSLALRTPDEGAVSGTASAALTLVPYLLREGRPEDALEVTAAVQASIASNTFHMLRLQGIARLRLNDLDGAFYDLRQAATHGETEASVFYATGNALRRMERVGEAALFYEFYRRRVSECSAGAQVFCRGRTDFADTITAEARARGQTLRMLPGIIGRAGLRALLELLAVSAAAMFAVVRPGRARMYAGRGLIVAEIVFFIAVFVTRLDSLATAQPIEATSVTWIVTVTTRAFLLATGGFYLSALAGTSSPSVRGGRRYAMALLSCVLALAGVIGLQIGRWPGTFTEPPTGQQVLARDVALRGFGPGIRAAELGLPGENTSERVAGSIRIVLDELSGRVVLPALLAYAVAAIPLFSSRRRRRWVGGAAAVVICAAAAAPVGLLAWAASFTGFGALVSARFYWGVWACILLHLTFGAGFVIGGVLG